MRGMRKRGFGHTARKTGVWRWQSRNSEKLQVVLVPRCGAWRTLCGKYWDRGVMRGDYCADWCFLGNNKLKGILRLWVGLSNLTPDRRRDLRCKRDDLNIDDVEFIISLSQSEHKCCVYLRNRRWRSPKFLLSPNNNLRMSLGQKVSDTSEVLEDVVE